MKSFKYNIPVDISGNVVGENPDCLLFFGTVAGENPDHFCWDYKACILVTHLFHPFTFNYH